MDVQWHIHKGSPKIPILSQINPIPCTDTYFFRVHSNIVLPSTSRHYHQGPDFDDMSSFFPCEIDDATQYINLGYEAQAQKIVIFWCIFRHFVLFFSFRPFFVILASLFCHIFKVYYILKSFFVLLHFAVIYSSF